MPCTKDSSIFFSDHVLLFPLLTDYIQVRILPVLPVSLLLQSEACLGIIIFL